MGFFGDNGFGDLFGNMFSNNRKAESFDDIFDRSVKASTYPCARDQRRDAIKKAEELWKSAMESERYEMLCTHNALKQGQARLEAVAVNLNHGTKIEINKDTSSDLHEKLTLSSSFNCTMILNHLDSIYDDTSGFSQSNPDPFLIKFNKDMEMLLQGKKELDSWRDYTKHTLMI